MKTRHQTIATTCQRGSGLLELLLALAIFMFLLPYIYDFAASHKNRAENIIVVKKVKAIQYALEQYVIENKQKLLAPISDNVIRVNMRNLSGIDLSEFKDDKVQLRVVKSKDSGGQSFIQGVVIFDTPGLDPMRVRQIAALVGNESGFADGRTLYGGFGTWRVSTYKIGAETGDNSIIAQTRPFRSGGDYIQRLPSTSPLDSTMQSDINLGNQNINNVKNLDAVQSRFLEFLQVGDGISTSKMTVANRLDWASSIEVMDSATVMGSITSDNRSLDSMLVSISGNSEFRNATIDELSVDNLYLSGFSVSNDGSPAIMAITGALDMIRGHIKSIDAFVGFSGSVTPKLIVTGQIIDGQNPVFQWNLSGQSANLGDIYLTNLAKNAPAAYSAERTGKTETERIMGSVIQNRNATVSDYIRALEQVKKVVTEKYAEIVEN